MEITRIKTQVSITWEQVLEFLCKVQTTLESMRESAATRLKGVWRESEIHWRKFRAGSRDATAVAKGNLGRFGARVFDASKRLRGPLERTQSGLRAMGKAAGEKLEKVRCESEKEFRKAREGSREAMVFASGKMSELGAQVSAAAKQAAAPVQKAERAVVDAGKRVVEKPRRMREARLAKENELQNMLTSSQDAVAVTDSEGRFVAANAGALELFGISEYNMGKFTMGTFLGREQNVGYEGGPSEHGAGAEKYCRRKIRRLDGGLWMAECEFVAEYLPGRSLYKFLNIAPYKLTPLRLAARKGATARPRAGVTPADLKKQMGKLPRHGVRPVY